jgi:hypothetical protein
MCSPGSDLHFGMKSMVVGGATSIQVARVAEVRRRHQPLISWSAILIKAIALVAKEWPDLRRAYMPFPWAHLYEHPHNVATVVLEREWRNAPAVFFDQIQQPEKKSLREIDYELRVMRMAKIESLGGYRRLIRITRYPFLLRRLLWRIVLQGSGRLRAKYFGTFAINSMVSRRVQTTQITTPITLSIYYGPIHLNGEMPVQVFFDHRVIDASSVYRIGLDIQTVLNHEIVAELNRDPTTSQASSFDVN